MRHCVARKLRRPGLMDSLLCGLIKHGHVRTTVQRAKLIRPVFEKLITKARTAKGNLAQFRLISARLGGSELAKQLIEKVCPMVENRPGGYTRILKFGKPRNGDGAREALIALVHLNEAKESNASAAN
jgi:large subunit ribosomal protein L17